MRGEGGEHTEPWVIRVLRRGYRPLLRWVFGHEPSDGLRRDLPHARIHYWRLPVIEAGRIDEPWLTFDRPWAGGNAS